MWVFFKIEEKWNNGYFFGLFVFIFILGVGKIFFYIEGVWFFVNLWGRIFVKFENWNSDECYGFFKIICK